MKHRRGSWALLCVAAALSTAAPASAQVFQAVDNTPLPQPVGQAELDLMLAYGYRVDLPVHQDFDGNNVNPPKLYSDYYPTFENGDAVKLSGLFKWRMEQIDEVADARTTPGYFSPTCGFSGQLVLRGGSCDVAFGWYNVLDPADPTPPAPDQIYELIPAETAEYMMCVDQNGNPKTDGFCPLGWDDRNPYKLSVHGWQPTAFDSGVIKSDPRYLGGYVAFALIGNPDVQCSQTKFSIAEHNVKSTSGEPWVTSIIYQSTVDPEAFYIAFEDLPMTPESWKDPGPGAIGENDGDFNDFVYYISGINCAGGGQACDTGLLGACSVGRTDCAPEGTTGVCRPIVQAGAELCDNVDNDCNGVVDDGEGLCAGGLVCDQGSCVQSCSTGEFRCPDGKACENDHCIDEACVGVVCEQGQACRLGMCLNACDGVLCPEGQECQLGRCVDPCAGVECPADRVCERGLCVSNCACRGCADGLTCGDDGRCGDPLCAGVVCPEGQKCKAGACQDLCANVTCPGGAQCINGVCADPSQMPTGSGGSGIVINTGGTNSGSGEGSRAPTRALGDGAGCACRAGSAQSPSAMLFGALLALGLWRARRRKA